MPLLAAPSLASATQNRRFGAAWRLSAGEQYEAERGGGDGLVGPVAGEGQPQHQPIYGARRAPVAGSGTRDKHRNLHAVPSKTPVMNVRAIHFPDGSQA